MPDTQAVKDQPTDRIVRTHADAYVDALADLDPLVGTMFGTRPGDDRMPDLSPEGDEAGDHLSRAVLAGLDVIERDGITGGAHERRCARLLRERLTARLALTEIGEHLRPLSNIIGPVQSVRIIFTVMPTASDDDWAVIARRMAGVPGSFTGLRAALTEGARLGLFAAPRQVGAVRAQLADWIAAGDGRGWFAEFADQADVPSSIRAQLDRNAATAIEAVADLRDWLADWYLPRAEHTPDAVGADRYRVLVRYRTGADLDLAEVYDWGWSEFRRLRADMTAQADRVLPGATFREAVTHLDTHGTAVTGVEEIRLWLQDLLDTTIGELDGTHFDLSEQVKVVQSWIAPKGSASAPYYSRPAADFSRPGRTWLPVGGRTRFPLWKLVSTWYHEGVPGHHLQFGQWTSLSGELSRYQTSVGSMSANTEGWALYAERLMDELGYLSDPGIRLGYLEAQMRRAIRVIIDIGMHLELTLPDDAPLAAGQTWTPELGREFFGSHTARDDEFLDSEIVRYLGVPAQAICYKVGERAWLKGRAAARAARGADFDLKSWHTAALGLGALGLDDLAAELSQL
ncbi:MAG TPA: DUF885 domain-containing protein [Pseudonocardiaceae bacterium]|nr:DUF885 domain-containing protein [Pseudonocardiaceae bacterium]